MAIAATYLYRERRKSKRNESGKIKPKSSDKLSIGEQNENDSKKE